MANGMYGNPNSTADWYEPNEAKRYKKYAENREAMKRLKNG